MPRPKKSRGTVRTEWDPLDVLVVGGKFVVPTTLTAHAELDDGLRVVVEIEVIDERARARRIDVSTDAPRGIGWTAFSNVPTRDIVATAVLDAMRIVDPSRSKQMTTLGLRHPGEDDVDDVKRVIQQLVGYRLDFDTIEVAS